MASFTDAIPQFNPYIQQLPIDAMVQVGMAKQKRYDEGIQRIQSQIDNIAGMDVIKDSQKVYLQSKLNELGSKLKTVAAGDFSNYQLVNSVGGMTNQIIKDPVIQNAVMSTQIMRKGDQQRDAAKAAGKGSVQNDEWWRKQKADWLNDGKVDTRFNGEYVEYTDISKKLREIAKDVPEIESSTDIPFKRDALGRVQYGADGKPELDMVMLRTKVKGKSAQKLLENFTTSLTENDIRQLQIDSWHHYRGATPQSMRNKLIETMNEKKELISHRIVEIAAELSTNTKLTEQEKTTLTANLGKYQTQLSSGEIEKETAKTIDEMTSNPEAFKYKLYTQHTLQKAAKDMAYESVITTMEDNPGWKAAMDMNNYNLSVRRLNEEIRYHNLVDSREQQKINIELAKLAQTNTSGLENTIVQDLPIPTDKLVSVTDAIVQKGLMDLLEEQNKLSNSYGNKYIPGFGKMTSSQQYAAVQKVMTDYIASPRTIKDGDQRDLLNRYRNNILGVQEKAQSISEVNKSVKQYDDAIKDATKGYKSFNVYGQKYTSEDYIKMLNDTKKYQKSERSIGASPYVSGRTMTIFDGQKFLNDYKGTPKEGLANLIYKNFTGQKMNAGEKSVYNQMIQAQQQVSSQVSSLIDQRNIKWATEMAKRDVTLQSVTGALNMEDKTTAARVNGVITNMNRLFNEQGGTAGATFNPNTILEWQSGKEKPSYSVVKNGDGSGSLVVTKGTDEQVINLNPIDFVKYFPELAKKSPLQDLPIKLLNSQNRTTNKAGLVNREEGAINAAYTGDDFNTLLKGSPLASKVRFDIEGLSSNDASGNDQFNIRMYVFDSNAGNWKQDLITPKSVFISEIPAILSQVGTRTMEDVLNK